MKRRASGRIGVAGNVSARDLHENQVYLETQSKLSHGVASRDLIRVATSSSRENGGDPSVRVRGLHFANRDREVSKVMRRATERLRLLENVPILDVNWWEALVKNCSEVPYQKGGFGCTSYCYCCCPWNGLPADLELQAHRERDTEKTH